MKFNDPLLFFICSIGVFNGFLASFYFLFFSKQKRVQNLFFGLLLLLLSIRIGKSVYVIFTEPGDRNLFILQVGLSACFLIGVSLFYYLKSSVENTKIIPKSWKFHIVILISLILIIGILKPYHSNNDIWRQYIVHTIYIVWGIYIVYSGYILRTIFRKFFKQKTVCTTSELWLIAVFCR